MAFAVADRVKETTTTTGTGTLSLAGAETGFQTFVAGVGSGNTTYYAIIDDATGDYEVGVGTVTDATPDTLSRDTVFTSSNSDAKVNFQAGSKNVFVTQPADKAVYKDSGSDTVTIDKIQLSNQSSHPTYSQGLLWYDTIHNTLNYYGDESDIVHEVGMEEHQKVYNNSGVTINKGEPMYFSGNFNGYPTVGKADATDVNKYNAQGLAGHDIENNSYGYLITAGLVEDIDTSGLTAGQNFFVGLTAGAVQNDSPTYPNYPMCLGWVVNSDASNGVLLVNQQNHSVNSFRVRTDTHIGGDMIIDGDLTVVGAQTVASSTNVETGAPFLYLNSGDTIGEANTTFTGSGLDDAYFAGHFSGTASTTYYVKIDATGTPDTFSWSKDNFSTTEATGVSITGEDQTLDSGIKINFGATTGHTLNDVWSGTAAPTNVDTGIWSNRNTGGSGVGYTHVGLFFDVTDSKFKLVDEYDPEPTGTINTGDASYSAGTLVVDDIEGVDGTLSGALSVTGNITVGGNVDGRDVATDGTKLDGIESGATADQTDAEIKTAYENNSDTNAFTDALLTKLNGIETSATADQTAADIRALGFFDTSNDGSGSGLDADLLDGNHASAFAATTGDDFTGQVTITSTLNPPLEIKRDAGSATTGNYVNLRINTQTTGTPADGLGSMIDFYVDDVIKGRAGYTNDGDFHIKQSDGSTDSITVDSTGDTTFTGDVTVNAKISSVGANSNGTTLATSASNAKIKFQNHSGSTLSSYEGYTGSSWYQQIANGAGTTAYDLALNPYGGSVGIGDSTPEKTLTVSQSANGEVARFKTTAGGDGGVQGNVSIGLSHFNAVTHPAILLEAEEIANASYQCDFHIKTRNAESDSAPATRLTVASDGKVGIGVTDPDSALEVQSSASGVNSVHLSNTNSGGYGAKFVGGGTTATQYVADFRDYSGSSKLRIDGLGNVGIGVTPSAWKTSSDEKVLQVDTASFYANNGNNSYLNNNWYLNSSSQSIYIESDFATSFASEDGKFVWYQTGSGTAGGTISWDSAMTLDASGNLLIGRTSVGATGNGHSIRGGDSAIFSRDASGETVQIGRNANNGQLVRFNRDGLECGAIATRGSLMRIGKGDVGLEFHDTDNRIYPANITSATLPNGTIDLGYTGYQFKDLYLSGTAYIGGNAALTTATTFGGDVSGTYNAIVVANDSHNHKFFTVNGTTDLNSVPNGSWSNFVPFTSNFQASNRPGTNYAGGFEIGVASSSDNYRGQLAFVAGGANVGPYVRTKTSGTWNSWNELWHSGNDGSGSGLDADTVDGIQGASFLRSDASDSVTNYTHKHQYYSNTNAATTSSGQASLECYSSGAGNDAFMAFHVGGDYATYFGLDGDTNDLFVGGWSKGAVRYKIWHAGNDGSGSGLDADTVDGIQASSFLRSDTADTATAPVTISGSDDQKIILSGSTSPYIRWQENTTDRAYIQWAAGSDALRFRNQQADNFEFMTHTTTGAIALKLMGSDGDLWGWIYATDSQEVGFLDEGGNWAYRHTNDSSHTWNIADTERMLLDNSKLKVTSQYGNIQIGPTNSSYCHITTDRSQFYFNQRLVVNSGQIQSYDEDLNLNRTGSTTARLRITSGSTISDQDLTVNSDERIKDNIELIDSALDKVQAIRGVTYNRTDTDDPEKEHTGVIAQDVEKVLPQVVHEDDKGIKSVAYGNMVGLLIEAIKEQQTQIDDLKAEVTRLKGLE